MKFLGKLVVTLWLMMVCLSAQAVTFNKVQVSQSTINFVFKQMGVPIEGKFTDFKVQLQFNPTKLESAQARIEIPLIGIDAGGTEANEEVKGKNWFNTLAFPTAEFVSSNVKSLEDNRYEVMGNLTIKGKTHPLTAGFTFKLADHTGHIEGNFTLKRSQFNIGEGVWSDTETVADEVHIRFKFVVLSEP